LDHLAKNQTLQKPQKEKLKTAIGDQSCLNSPTLVVVLWAIMWILKGTLQECFSSGMMQNSAPSILFLGPFRKQKPILKAGVGSGS